MDLTPDPLVTRLASTVRERLAEVPAGADPVDALRGIEAFALEAPVGAGGFDLGLVCGVVVGTELGRRALRTSYADALFVLDALPSGTAPEALATELAAGTRIVQLAGLDPVRVSAEPAESGWTLTGSVSLPDPAELELCVPFTAGGEVLLALLPQQDWTAGRGVSTVDISGQAVAPELVVGRLTDSVLGRARIRHAAYLLGLAEGALQHAVGHATRRRQFDRTLLEFQGVSFPLARAAVAVSALRLAVHQAGWLADVDRPFGLAAVQSLALAADTAVQVVRAAVQVHGARGMTVDAPISAYYQALRFAVTRFGSPAALWREAGRRRLAAAHQPVAVGREGAP